MPVCERDLLEANVPALALSENEVGEDHGAENSSQNNEADRRPATGTRSGRGRTNPAPETGFALLARAQEPVELGLGWI